MERLKFRAAPYVFFNKYYFLTKDEKNDNLLIFVIFYIKKPEINYN